MALKKELTDSEFIAALEVIRGKVAPGRVVAACMIVVVQDASGVPDDEYGIATFALNIADGASVAKVLSEGRRSYETGPVEPFTFPRA